MFQPPSPSTYGLDGSGLPLGVHVALEGDTLLVVADRIAPSFGVIWLHGNACDCGDEASALLFFAEQFGAFCVAPEYPGYGASTSGQSSPESIDAVANVAFQYLRQRVGPDKRIIVCGRSLGTGPAVGLAVRAADEVSGLLLWSPINSVRGIAKSLLGPLSSLVGKRWDVVDLISKLAETCQVALLAGSKDTLTTLDMAEEIIRAANPMTQITLSVVEGATHNTGWDLARDVAPLLAALGPPPSLLEMSPLEEQMRPEESLDRAVPSAEPSLIRIVGAGPVGLFLTACLLELGVSASNIVMEEKYASYRRHHVLRLEKSSLANAPPRIRAALEKLVGTTKTSLIEELLKQIVVEAGVLIRRPSLIQDSILEVLPFTERVLIGCDGAKSTIRTQLMGGETRRESLQHVADVRLQILVAKAPEKLTLTQQLYALKQTEHIIEESISRKPNEQGLYPATLRLLISESEHHHLREAGATLRDPMQLPRDLNVIPKAVAQSIRAWLAIRQAHFAEERYHCITITSLDLCVYASACVGRRLPSRQSVFLCGDSNFGVPFFRALNCGLMCASSLAPIVVEELSAPARAGPNLIPNLSDSPSSRDKSLSLTAMTKEKESSGFFGRAFASMAASTSVSRHLTEMSARGASNVVADLVMPVAADPVTRYANFCERLIVREFSLARLKRDSLTIVRLGNVFRQRLPNGLIGAPPNAAAINSNNVFIALEEKSKSEPKSKLKMKSD